MTKPKEEWSIDIIIKSCQDKNGFAINIRSNRLSTGGDTRTKAINRAIAKLTQLLDMPEEYSNA